MLRVVTLVIVSQLAGCASFIDNKAASSTMRILEKSMVAASRQSDLQLAREALPGGIMQLEAFSLAYPDHRGFRVMHADALCQYAVAFVFDDWEDASLTGKTDAAAASAERLTGLLTSCVDANVAMLPAAWRDAHGRGLGAIEKLLPKLTRAEIPRVLWIAMAGAVRIALAPAANFRSIGPVKAILARVAEVWPGYHDADAEILLGTLEAGMAAFLGGADGAARFEAARKLTGGVVLSVEVMFARGVAVARKDRALFTSTLERVIAADLGRWPDHRLANELAHKKARRYLAAIDSMIPASTP
jgi:TRAP transporter T-component